LLRLVRQDLEALRRFSLGGGAIMLLGSFALGLYRDRPHLAL